MKAIQLIKYGEAQNAFKTADIPIPSLLDDDDILIKVDAFGLNFADIMARKGLYRAAPPLPAVLGYEVVGEIIKVKSANYNYLLGQKALCLTRFGGYAEFVKSKVSIIKTIPATLTDGQALALATQYCTAFLALDSCSNLNASDVILVHSASGGVGTAITQLAKIRGIKVIGLTRSEEKVDYLIKNGVDYPIVTTKSDYCKIITKNKNLTKIQASFNSVGGATLKKDIQVLDINGQIVFFGISDRTNQKKGVLFTLFQLFKIGKIHPAKLLLNSQAIRGLNLLAIGDKNPKQLTKALEELISLVEQKKLTPSTGNEYSWDELSLAHHRFEKGKFTGKFYIKVNK
jgi:NADPH2:quinone reductase